MVNSTSTQERGWTVVPLFAVLGTLAVVIVCIRLWVRAFQQHQRFDVSDWLILVSIPPSIAVLVIICLGYDRHVYDLTLEQDITEAKVFYAGELIYIWAAGLIKLSILFFYLRLADRSTERIFISLVYATILFVIGFIIAFTFAGIFSCIPVDGYWNRYNPVWDAQHNVSCIEEYPVRMAAAVISAVQDYMIALLPSAMIYHLQIPRRQKIALVMLFAVGIFTAAAGTIRAPYFYFGLTSNDVSWDSYPIWIWTGVEICFGMYCSSAPALKALFRQFFESRSQRPSQNTSGRSRNSKPAERPGRSSNSLKHMTSGSVDNNDRERHAGDTYEMGSKATTSSTIAQEEYGIGSASEHQPESMSKEGQPTWYNDSPQSSTIEDGITR